MDCLQTELIYKVFYFFFFFFYEMKFGLNIEILIHVYIFVQQDIATLSYKNEVKSGEGK